MFCQYCSLPLGAATTGYVVYEDDSVSCLPCYHDTYRALHPEKPVYQFVNRKPIPTSPFTRMAQASSLPANAVVGNRSL